MFYQPLKAKRSQNRVNAIQNSDGVWVNQRAKVDDAFVSHYKQLFSCIEQRQPVLKTLIDKGKKLTEHHLSIVQQAYTKGAFCST